MSFKLDSSRVRRCNLPDSSWSDRMAERWKCFSLCPKVEKQVTYAKNTTNSIGLSPFVTPFLSKNMMINNVFNINYVFLNSNLS